MPQADYLKRLEDKVNRAIEHIEKLTVENERLAEENNHLQDSLRACQNHLTQGRLEESERTGRAREKLRSILYKIDSLNNLE